VSQGKLDDRFNLLAALPSYPGCSYDWSMDVHVPGALEMPMTIKQADTPASIDAANVIKEEAFRNILAAGLIGSVLGAGGRSFLGRSYLFGRPPQPPLSRLGDTATVNLPVPVYANKEDERKARHLPKFAKAAEDIGTPGIIERFTKPLYEGLVGWTRRGYNEPGSTPRGDYAASHFGLPDHWSIPWYLPGVTAAAGAGLYGGFHGADALLKEKRKRDLASEVTHARQEFEKALISQYDPQHLPKEGSVPSVGQELGQTLDAIYDKLEASMTKEASLGGLGMGLLGTLALILGTGGATAGYHWAQERTPPSLIAEAYRRRERERLENEPAQLIANPTAVHVSRAGDLHPVNLPA
jgi:hypothetical protein